MTTTTKKTAEQTYRENARDIDALLDFLGMELQARREEYELEGINWAHAGSMANWREKILETLVSVMGAYEEKECRQMIEDALDDVKA